MSIAFADVAADAIHPSLLIWTGLAMILVVAAGGLRRPDYLTRRRESQALVPVLAAAAILTFVGGLLVQVVYAMVLRIISESTGQGSSQFDTDPRHRAILSLAVPLISLTVSLRMIQRTSAPREIGLLGNHPFRALLHGALMAAIAIPAALLALLVTSSLLQALDMPHPVRHPLMELLTEAPPAWMHVAIAFSAVVLAPLSEELLFRGLVQTSFRKVTGRPWLAILVASALFALLHPWWSWLAIFVLSLFIGILYERTRNLWAAIAIHALFNSYMLITFNRT